MTEPIYWSPDFADFDPEHSERLIRMLERYAQQAMCAATGLPPWHYLPQTRETWPGLPEHVREAIRNQYRDRWDNETIPLAAAERWADAEEPFTVGDVNSEAGSVTINWWGLCARDEAEGR